LLFKEYILKEEKACKLIERKCLVKYYHNTNKNENKKEKNMEMVYNKNEIGVNSSYSKSSIKCK
jgi:hypothetical protein